LGDAVYNQADPRWRLLRPVANLPGLPRLPGSAREVAACARTWNSSPQGSILLTGRQVCLRDLELAIQKRPAVLHFATHVVPAGREATSGSIVLSLAASGEPELLGPTEIQGWRVPGSLVVLSGCSSGVA